MLTYHRGDERPAWQETVTVSGVADNMASGYTFQVKIYAYDTPASPLLTKSTNITGAAGGVVNVTWVPNELDIAPGAYVCQLKATRTSDSAEWTVRKLIWIKPRA